jgi:hypothetical protein
MNLQNFSSIFEIFATFTLAYIIIDELTENPFISLITEKIFRKYQRVERIFDGVRNKIAGHKTSLNNIQQAMLENPQDILGEHLPGAEKLLKSIEERVNQSYLEIRSQIRLNYATKVFVYLNCYLFLYCLTALIYGGMYSDNKGFNAHNYHLDQSLFVFCASSFILLVTGWRLDKRPIFKNADEEDNQQKSVNGYVVVAVCYCIVIILSILTYFLGWKIINFELEYCHTILTLACIFLPILNFIVYMLKARKRANLILPNLEDRARSFRSDYSKELEKVENFLGMCNFLSPSPGEFKKVPTDSNPPQ